MDFYYQQCDKFASDYPYSSPNKLCKELYALLENAATAPQSFINILPMAVHQIGWCFNKLSVADAADAPALLKDPNYLPILADNYYKALTINAQKVEASVDLIKNDFPYPDIEDASRKVGDIAFATLSLFGNKPASARDADWLKEQAWIWGDKEIFSHHINQNNTGVKILETFCDGFQAKDDRLNVFLFEKEKALLCCKKTKDLNAAAILNFDRNGELVTGVYIANDAYRLSLYREEDRSYAGLKGFHKITPQEKGTLTNWQNSLKPAIQYFQQQLA